MIEITRTSGTEYSTLPFPGGVEIHDSRSAYIASGFYTYRLYVDCSYCGEVAHI